jgi:hypothetical protein
MHSLPYVMPLTPQTGMNSLVHATGFAFSDGISGFIFLTSLHSLSPQILLAVFEPKAFAPWVCGEPCALAASATPIIANDVKNAADNNTLTVSSDSIVFAMILKMCNEL